MARQSRRHASQKSGPLPFQPARLPLELTSFVGRTAELAELERLLPRTRLLTLVGIGGSGKTRLARRLAQLIEGRYPDGVCWVDLAGVQNSDLLPSSVVKALAISENPDDLAIAALTAALAKRSLLLLLDNCEHLLDAAGGLIAAILDGCPSVSVLATSREQLGLPGELRWLVPPLALPPERDDGHDLVSRAALEVPLANLPSEALQLFLERARAVRPGFALTAETIPAVAQICRALDGLPLAIELAAVLVRMLTVKQIAQRLDDRLRLLSDGGRGVAARHQTLRLAFDWSFALLSETERTLFGRLAVFAGSCALDAIEQICVGGEISLDAILGTLGRLVDKSLIAVEFTSEEARYRLLETARLYASERLQEAGEAEERRGRHAAFYLDLTSSWQHLSASMTVRAFMDRLDSEWNEIRAALTWSQATSPDQAGAFFDAVDDLAPFWFTRGHFGDATHWIGKALSVVESAEPARRARVLIQAGWLAARRNDLDEAQAFGRRAVEQGLQAGDRLVVARTRVLQAWILLQSGDSKARPVSEEAVADLRGFEAPGELGLALLLLSGALAAEGKRDAARATAYETLTIAHVVQYDALAASALSALAQFARQAGDFGEAAVRVAEALALLPRTDAVNLAFALEELATIAADSGDLEKVAWLAGAGAGYRATDEIRPPNSDHRDFWPRLDFARESLGSEAFTEAYEAGRHSSPERVLRKAHAIATKIGRAASSGRDWPHRKYRNGSAGSELSAGPAPRLLESKPAPGQLALATPTDTTGRSASPSRDATVAMLAQSALFGVLSTRSLVRLLPSLRSITVQAGTLICRQGEPGDHLYQIAHGRFSVRIRSAGASDTFVRVLEPGDCFGEISLLTDQPHSATVRCERDGELLTLAGSRFLELLRREPVAGKAAAAILGRWLQTQKVGPGAPPEGHSPHDSNEQPDAAPSRALSRREAEVLALLAAGLSNTELAGALVISLNTVERHINHIFAKLGVSTRAQAIVYAHQHGLAGSR